MKKIIAALGISLSMALPVNAEKLIPTQPTVKAHSLAAMGCMILRECTEGIELLTTSYPAFKEKDFDLFREEIISILNAMEKVNVPIYIAPTRYFTPRTIGLYKPDYNRLFINEELLKDPREFLGTLRHEGWHVVQDCMAGGIKTSFMAQVHQDSEIPALDNENYETDIMEVNGYVKVVLFPGKQMLIQQKRTTKYNFYTLRNVC
jgi:hypothetical protein